MQTGHGGEYVGVAPVEAVEYSQAGHLVECAQTRSVARGAEQEFSAVLGYVPGWSSRMNIVAGEPDEVYQQKYQREVKIRFFLPGEIQPESECYRHRYPAEIEHSSQKIHQPRCVLGEEFVGGEYPPGGSYAEKRALRIVDSLDVDCVDFVVVDYVHPVVAYTEHYEGEQRHHQAPRGAADEKERGNQQSHPDMFGPEPDAHGRHRKPHGQRTDDY